MSFTLAVISIGFLFFVATCLAILDAAQRDFGSLEKKAVWVFVAVIPFVGFVVYFLKGVKQGARPGKEPPKADGG